MSAASAAAAGAAAASGGGSGGTDGGEAEYGAGYGLQHPRRCGKAVAERDGNTPMHPKTGGHHDKQAKMRRLTPDEASALPAELPWAEIASHVIAPVAVLSDLNARSRLAVRQRDGLLAVPMGARLLLLDTDVAVELALASGHTQDASSVLSSATSDAAPIPSLTFRKGARVGDVDGDDVVIRACFEAGSLRTRMLRPEVARAAGVDGTAAAVLRGEAGGSDDDDDGGDDHEQDADAYGLTSLWGAAFFDGGLGQGSETEAEHHGVPNDELLALLPSPAPSEFVAVYDTRELLGADLAASADDPLPIRRWPRPLCAWGGSSENRHRFDASALQYPYEIEGTVDRQGRPRLVLAEAVEKSIRLYSPHDGVLVDAWHFARLANSDIESWPWGLGVDHENQRVMAVLQDRPCLELDLTSGERTRTTHYEFHGRDECGAVRDLAGNWLHWKGDQKDLLVVTPDDTVLATLRFAQPIKSVVIDHHRRRCIVACGKDIIIFQSAGTRVKAAAKR